MCIRDRSDTEGELKVTTASHSLGSLFTIISAGQVITGASLSITVTSKIQLEVFPAASVTTKVLVVVPTGKIPPLAWPAVCVVVTAQLSVPTGAVYDIVAPQIPGSLFTVILAGHAITGSSSSITVISIAQVALTPALSV